MALNVEFKARVNRHEPIRLALDALEPSATERLEQTDTFFAVADGRLKLRELGDGSGELVFYRRPDTAKIKVSRYRRAKLDDPTAMRRLLSDALPVRGVIKKTRDIVLLGTTRVHLDTVDGLGRFVEIEVVLGDDQSTADGERIASDLLRQLRIPDAALIAGAYIDLLEGLSSRDEP